MHTEFSPEWSGADSLPRMAPLRRAICRINAHHQRDQYAIKMVTHEVKLIPLPLNRLNRRSDPETDFQDTIPVARIIVPRRRSVVRPTLTSSMRLEYVLAAAFAGWVLFNLFKV